jgi:beta-lactamase regulating signal transducer with metallopeptidase domain
MDIGSPIFLLLIIVGAFVMMKVMMGKKKIKYIRKQNVRLNYEVKNQILKNKMRKLKEEEAELKKKNTGGGW